MNKKTLIPFAASFLAALVLGNPAAAAAQCCGHCGGGQDGSAAKTASAPLQALPTARGQLVLHVPVAGLDAKNTALVEKRLTGISRVSFACPMHPAEQQATEGNCAVCGMKLQEKRTPVLSSVRLQPDQGLATFAVAGGQTLNMSELKEALTSAGASLREEGLPLGSRVTLRVSGMTCGGCANRLTKALKSLPPVQKVEVDLKSKEEGYATLTLGTEEGITYAQIARSVAGTPFRLDDLAWKAPKAQCCGHCGGMGAAATKTSGKADQSACCGHCGGMGAAATKASGKTVAIKTSEKADQSACCGHCGGNGSPKSE